MGYACPVCETPQRDGEHLAHHLAFTAMLHGDDHEAWLDDHVSDWADREPDGLAAEVTPHAADAEYHEMFEDTVDRGRPDVDGSLGANGHSGHDHGHGGHGHDHGHSGHDHGHGGHDAKGGVDGTDVTDPEAAAALREARELTRRMFEDGDDEGNNDGDAESNETDESDELPDSDPDA